MGSDSSTSITKYEEPHSMVEDKLLLSVIKNEHDVNPNVKYQITKEFKNNKIVVNFRVHHTVKSDVPKISWRSTIKKKFILIFFPRDYPHSVKPAYRKFVYYSFSQNVILYFLSFLSCQLLIGSLGVSPGNSKAFPPGSISRLRKESGRLLPSLQSRLGLKALRGT